MDGFWACAHTQPLQEQRASKELARQAYSVFLPMMRKRDGGMCPLFARYLFVYIDGRWSSISGTRGVSSLIMEGNKPAKVREGEKFIAELKRRQDANGLVELDRFRVGDRVRIEKGIMKGTVGIYQGMTSRERVNILLSMLGAERVTSVRETDLYYA